MCEREHARITERAHAHLSSSFVKLNLDGGGLVAIVVYAVVVEVAVVVVIVALLTPDDKSGQGCMKLMV